MEYVKAKSWARERWERFFPSRNPDDYTIIDVTLNDRILAFVLKLFGILIFVLMFVFVPLAEAEEIGAFDFGCAIVGCVIASYMLFRSIKSLFRKQRSILTDEARERIERERQEEMAAIEPNEDELGFKSSWYIRYPLAVGCLVLTFILADYAGDSEDEKFALAVWLWVAILGVFSLIYAREVSLLALGALLFYWFFKGIAALPISVAIVIGALIIASALKK